MRNFPIMASALMMLAVARLTVHAAPPPESPYSATPAPLTGQVRTRTEYDSKDMRDTAANKPLLSTQLRTRLGFTASPSEKIDVKVELQDSRFMGSEPPSAAANPASANTGNAKGIDLLQGYALIKEGNFIAALGRQKMALGAGRFLSTLEWSPASRSFDGLSFDWKNGLGDLTGLCFLVRDTGTTSTQDRVLLTGLHYNRPLVPGLTAEAYGFYEQSRLPATYGGLATQNYDLYYLGERLSGKAGMILLEEEFVWQGGELAGARNFTSAAFQLALRLGVALGANKINAGLDMMSGDDNLIDGNAKTYRANYYFAHALYGWMDYFANNPANGVTDYRVDGDFPVWPGAAGVPVVTLKPQYHFFTPQNALAATDDPYGQEVDVEVHLALFPKSNIVLGAALFLPGKSAFMLPAAKITNSAFSDKPGWFLYLMPAFNF